MSAEQQSGEKNRTKEKMRERVQNYSDIQKKIQTHKKSKHTKFDNKNKLAYKIFWNLTKH
jgi:hypothetical protein